MRTPDAVPKPSTTMTGVKIHSAQMYEDDQPGPRIVHLQFKRDVYSDCHMMVKPLGAMLMALDLFLTALVALVWVGNPAK